MQTDVAVMPITIQPVIFEINRGFAGKVFASERVSFNSPVGLMKPNVLFLSRKFIETCESINFHYIKKIFSHISGPSEDDHFAH